MYLKYVLYLLLVYVVYKFFRAYCMFFSEKRRNNFTLYNFDKHDLKNMPLQTGDILVYYSYDTNDLENFLNNDDWTHASIVIKEKDIAYVYEVKPCYDGLYITPLHQHLPEYCGSIVLLRPKQITNDQCEQIKHTLHTIKQQMNLFPNKRTYFDLVHSSFKSLFAHSTLAWCISLVAYVYQKSNIFNFDALNIPLLTPHDLLTDTRISQFFHTPKWIQQRNLRDKCATNHGDSFGLCLLK